MLIEEIEKEFSDFFDSRGYKWTKPEPLVSPAFPTTFTLSGGPNLIDEIMTQHGKQYRTFIEARNDFTIQPCIRVWDRDNVGDGKHLSFFEMPVLYSINNDRISRKAQLAQSLEFFKSLGIDINKCWITVFGGGKVRGKYFSPDEQTYKIWKELGIPQKRILILEGDKANESFIANAMEPLAGPRTEIFFEFEEIECSCENQIPYYCACGKYLEFFTSAIYEYEVEPEFHHRFNEHVKLTFHPLDNVKVWACGFGVERLSQILMNSPLCIYEVNRVKSITDRLVSFTGKSNKSTIVVSEMIRGLTFIVAQNIPSMLSGTENKWRRNEYNRYMRTFLQNLKTLCIVEKWGNLLKELVPEVISLYQTDYSELRSIGLINRVVEETYKKFTLLNL